MRVAIVNDVRMITEALRRIVLSTGQHEVAWTAEDGAEAVRRCLGDTPDLILMDLVMPEMNGAEATRLIMRKTPCPILVVTSTVSGNYALVCEALGHGAYDAIRTPSGSDDGVLLAKLGSVQRITRHLNSPVEETPALVSRTPAIARNGDRTPLVAIGASTGGPQALERMLAGWSDDLPVAGLIVQHIGEEYVASLVRWLNERCRLHVREARTGDAPEAGVVQVAASSDHLVMTRQGVLAYTDDPRDTPYRPSVDALFHSLARDWPAPGLAVLLTGIGRDGALGLLELRRQGWQTVAQDEATSVVFGMPQAAAQLGAAEHILPIDKMAPHVESWARRGGDR